MWWIIIILICLAFLLLCFSLCAASTKTDDYKDQQAAIERWKEKKAKRRR